MRIKCNDCKNQINSFCKVKKSKVAINKSRVCGAYIFDETKVKIKHEIPTTFRSDWFHKKKELKKLLKQQEAEERKRQEALVKQSVTQPPNYLRTPGTGDPKHLLTGDLSRFVSTAVREKQDG
jgi:hypothetical protein